MSGKATATVTVAEILELRADGLADEEIWSLLCQAVQTLQDLFLSESAGGNVVPVLSPRTLAISSKGSAVISLVDKIGGFEKEFLAPELRATGKRTWTQADREKMWIYSLGKTLSFALKPTSTDESLTVLKLMTTTDPSFRASLMSLLNIISEHCKTNQPLKPFSHFVMEMYKEVFGTPPQCLLSVDTSELNERSPSSSLFDKKHLDSRTSSTDGSSRGSEDGREVRRNPVQRAPSRLYRNASSPVAESRGPHAACVGPEFVVRGMEPSRVVHVGDAKAARRRSLTIVLLTGRKIRVTCEPHSLTCGKLFEIVVRVEELEDDYIFGLASAMNGDFVFVPGEMKLHKVAPSGWKEAKGPESPAFFLYVRVKVFLPSLRVLRNGQTKHLMYVQLRRSLLEQQIKCEREEMLVLGGLALQAEFGNHNEEEHGASSYFLLEHYLPEELVDEKSGLESLLQEQHRSRRGLERGLAEEIFVSRVQRLPEYGSHHHTALWVRKSVSIPMWVSVNPQGVYLYEKKKNVLDRKIHEAFVWKNIQGLSCNENYFRLVPHDVLGQKVTSYKLRMDNKKSYCVFRLASFHHQFFMKLRIELSSLHALSQEFGVGNKKEGKSVFYLEKSPRDWEPRKEYLDKTFTGENLEERQNKENENPLEPKREKRSGVKMGVSAFHSTKDFPDKLSGSGEFSEAFVMDSSVKSQEGKFSYELHESVPSALAERWEELSWAEERLLRKVRLKKDKYGSFGLEVVEGSGGGLFVENVLHRREEEAAEGVRRGDQLLGVNGTCLLNLSYAEALNCLKAAGSEIEILVARKEREAFVQQPPEHEYLKSIRYETATEGEEVDFHRRFY